MSFLAYSEIFGRAAGLKKSTGDNFAILARNDTTKIRFKALCALAREERDTISAVLEKIGENRSGGTYLSIQSYFQNLQKENILQPEEVGRRTYWTFQPTAKDLQQYLRLVKN